MIYIPVVNSSNVFDVEILQCWSLTDDIDALSQLVPLSFITSSCFCELNPFVELLCVFNTHPAIFMIVK